MKISNRIKENFSYRTIAVGRFLVDIPTSSIISWGRMGYEYAGPYIEIFEAKNIDFVQQIVNLEIKKINLMNSTTCNKIEKIISEPVRSRWFIFYWDDPANKSDLVQINGYFFKFGQAIIFKNQSKYTPENIDKIKTIYQNYIDKIQLVGNDIPYEKNGFVIKNLMIVGNGEAGNDPVENVEMKICFSNHPDVFVRFSTNTVDASIEDSPNLLERNKKGHPGHGRMDGVRIIHAKARTINSYHGYEIIKRIQEVNKSIGYSFMWEYPGKPNNIAEPSILLELMTGYAEKSINSSLSENEAYILWGNLISSIRFRK